MTGTTQIAWTEEALVRALKSRFASNEWAVVTQVRDGAGWDRRTFDAVAVGLWQSRGHPVHGFECKVSRSDWKRELAKPEKADPLVVFVNYWWVLTPPALVDPLSLPLGWGLLEARGVDGPIRTILEAQRRDAVPPTMGFVAQLAKRLLADSPTQAAIDAAEKVGHERGLAYAKANLDSRVGGMERELAELRQQIQTFEETSGLDLRRRYGKDNQRYAETVRKVFAMEHGWDSPVQSLHTAKRAAQRFIEKADALFPEINE